MKGQLGHHAPGSKESLSTAPPVPTLSAPPAEGTRPASHTLTRGRGRGATPPNSILGNPWTEGRGRLQSVELQGVGHDRNQLSLSEHVACVCSV